MGLVFNLPLQCSPTHSHGYIYIYIYIILLQWYTLKYFYFVGFFFFFFPNDELVGFFKVYIIIIVIDQMSDINLSF